MPAFSIE